MKKKKKKRIHPLIITIIVLAAIFFVLLLPIIPVTKEVSYQETVNRDGCDQSNGCACIKKGGFLWLECKQCSCTRYTTETKFVPLWIILASLE